jgi:hypothetical protein
MIYSTLKAKKKMTQVHIIIAIVLLKNGDLRGFQTGLIQPGIGVGYRIAEANCTVRSTLYKVVYTSRKRVSWFVWNDKGRYHRKPL